MGSLPVPVCAVPVLHLYSIQKYTNCQLYPLVLTSGPSICVFLMGFLVLSKCKLIGAGAVSCCV